MNAEELCKKMQEEKKADSDEYYEEEMSSSEYAHKVYGKARLFCKKTLEDYTRRTEKV